MLVWQGLLIICWSLLECVHHDETPCEDYVAHFTNAGLLLAESAPYNYFLRGKCSLKTESLDEPPLWRWCVHHMHLSILNGGYAFLAHVDGCVLHLPGLDRCFRTWGQDFLHRSSKLSLPAWFVRSNLCGGTWMIASDARPASHLP